MKPSLPLRQAIGLALCLFVPLCGEAIADHLTCWKGADFLAPADGSVPRNYAPDRLVKIRHLVLEVTPDFKQRTINARATMTFSPIAKPLQELKLNAVGLEIRTVHGSAAVQAYQVGDRHLDVTFARPIPAGRSVKLVIAYHAQPTKGIYFRTPAMGYPKGDTELFTQGEAIEARHWYPCLDAPDQKFTSEVIAHVPQGMTVISNGRLVSQDRGAGSGKVTFHWLQDKPHSNYLITLVAGYFKKVEGYCGNVPLAFYTPPSEFAEAPNSFAPTKDVMRFYEKEIGMPYPWDKYDQVCVHDFVAGGMENTSATTLTDRTLFTRATETIRSSQGLVAHEMAHQWFGDLVTCKDWSQIWLNEGFATFYAHLYDGHRNGRDAMLYGFYRDAKNILSHGNDTRPIVDRDYRHPMEEFSYLAYPKGSWVLRMLRAQLGKGLYRRCILTYLKRHRYGNVTTEDLNEVVEELSGRSFDRFFDQWVYHGHEPELNVSYHWDPATRLAKLTVRQVQTVSDKVLLFQFPLEVRFKTASRTVDRTVTVRQKEEDFYFPLPEAPKIVRVDPHYVLLGKTTFHLPEPMLYAQLKDPTDMIGRLLAIQQLKGQDNHKAVDALGEVLRTDSFYGVRMAAAQALRSLDTPEALRTLIAGVDQSDARVRRAVVSGIAGFYREGAYRQLVKVLSNEKNPDILNVAIRGLARYAKPEVMESLLHFLYSKSFRNELAVAAIQAAQETRDPAYVDPLENALRRGKPRFTSHGLAVGLSALANLAQSTEKKDGVREFLTPYVNDLRPVVRLAAIGALGRLGSTKAIAVLETFAQSGNDSPEAKAAQKAISQLESEKPPSAEFNALRGEVLKLQQSNHKLQQEFDDLKKQWDTLKAPTHNSQSASSAVKSQKQQI